MRNQIRAFEADLSRIEVIEHTNMGIPFLYTVIADADESLAPRVESYEVEIGEHPDVAKNKALEVFNREVIEYVSATI